MKSYLKTDVPSNHVSLSHQVLSHLLRHRAGHRAAHRTAVHGGCDAVHAADTETITAPVRTVIMLLGHRLVCHHHLVKVRPPKEVLSKGRWARTRMTLPMRRLWRRCHQTFNRVRKGDYCTLNSQRRA